MDHEIRLLGFESVGQIRTGLEAHQERLDTTVL